MGSVSSEAGRFSLVGMKRAGQSISEALKNTTISKKAHLVPVGSGMGSVDSGSIRRINPMPIDP
jgi:hypothetical protein